MEKSIKIKFITYSLLCLAHVGSYFLSCCKLQFRLVGVETIQAIYKAQLI